MVGGGFIAHTKLPTWTSGTGTQIVERGRNQVVIVVMIVATSAPHQVTLGGHQTGSTIVLRVLMDVNVQIGPRTQMMLTSGANQAVVLQMVRHVQIGRIVVGRCRVVLSSTVAHLRKHSVEELQRKQRDHHYHNTYCYAYVDQNLNVVIDDRKQRELSFINSIYEQRKVRQMVARAHGVGCVGVLDVATILGPSVVDIVPEDARRIGHVFRPQVFQDHSDRMRQLYVTSFA